MHTTRRDGVTDIKRRRRNLSSDGVRNLATASGRGRLKRGSRIIYVATALGLQRDAVHCLGDCKTSCEVFATLTSNPPPPKRDNLAKDSICHHYKEVGHWRRNCPSYQAELKKKKEASMASNSGIFTIELYAFPNKTWVYDTGCGTHICNTLQGLRRSKKLKHGALSLYMGNGMHATVEAIGSFDLILPSGLIIVLDICHFAPTVTRGVVSIS
ncbi:zinc finger, CCHC-type containing protein [Tanacetum coccineum]